MRQDGRVSLWLGNIATESSLDTYLGEGFPRDFGFLIKPRCEPEYAIGPPKGIAELVSRAFGARQWSAQAVEMAASQGWVEATTAVVFHAFAYERALIVNERAPLFFLGVVDFGG